MLIRKVKEENPHFEVAQSLLNEKVARYWNEIYNAYLYEKDIDMLDFVILNIDLALKRYCL